MVVSYRKRCAADELPMAGSPDALTGMSQWLKETSSTSWALPRPVARSSGPAPRLPIPPRLSPPRIHCPVAMPPRKSAPVVADLIPSATARTRVSRRRRAVSQVRTAPARRSSKAEDSAGRPSATAAHQLAVIAMPIAQPRIQAVPTAWSLTIAARSKGSPASAPPAAQRRNYQTRD